MEMSNYCTVWWWHFIDIYCIYAHVHTRLTNNIAGPQKCKLNDSTCSVYLVHMYIHCKPNNYYLTKYKYMYTSTLIIHVILNWTSYDINEHVHVHVLVQL